MIGCLNATRAAPIKFTRIIFPFFRRCVLRAMALLCLVIIAIPGCAPPLETVTLEDDTVSMEITLGLGGRVLSFSLKGRDNLLKVGEPVASIPNPEVSADADNIGYLGHIVWVGPQKDWWVWQNVNPERLNAKATWPPDPYLIFAENKIIEHSPGKLMLEGVKSPVSGVRLYKSFSLVNNRPGTVALNAEVVNVSEKKVSWDIWFNTRVSSSTRVYVPVSSDKDVHSISYNSKTAGPVEYSVTDGLFTLHRGMPPDMTDRQGKVFIQPLAGWMAGFTADQVFIIEFPLQSREAIHPEHGQVEIYLNYRSDKPEEGLIEMEVHAPYRTLEPGQSMQAGEQWTALSYGGPDDEASHVSFLKKYFKNL